MTVSCGGSSSFTRALTARQRAMYVVRSQSCCMKRVSLRKHHDELIQEEDVCLNF